MSQDGPAIPSMVPRPRWTRIVLTLGKQMKQLQMQDAWQLHISDTAVAIHAADSLLSTVAAELHAS